MQKSNLIETINLLGQIVNIVMGTIPSSATTGQAGSQIKFDAGALLGNASEQILGGTAAKGLATVFTDAQKAGATLETMSNALNMILALPAQSTAAVVLVQTAVVYTLAQEAIIIGNTTYDSRNEVEAVMLLVGSQFQIAIEAAADANQTSLYLTLISLQAAVTNWLVVTQQPLPALVGYSFGKALPSLVIAQKLYADASRADEIISENGVIAPLFCPLSGVALSS